MTLAALAERTGYSPHPLAQVLGDEVRRGRVVQNARGGYALVAAAFTPETLTALRELA